MLENLKKNCYSRLIYLLSRSKGSRAKYLKLVLGGDSSRIIDSYYPYATRCSPSLVQAQGK